MKPRFLGVTTKKYGQLNSFTHAFIQKKVKWSLYRPGVVQRMGRGIALLFHDCGTRRGWVVSSTPRPHFTPGKDPVPILQEAGWAPGPIWTGGKSRPHRDSIPDRPARSQSLYRLSYPAHMCSHILANLKNNSTFSAIWTYYVSTWHTLKNNLFLFVVLYKFRTNKKKVL